MLFRQILGMSNSQPSMTSSSVYSEYNPDFCLEDGSWLEATLSENTAYKKLFKHGHQAKKLTVLWLDKDTGRHSEVCKKVAFPNASVQHVLSFYSNLSKSAQGTQLLEHFSRLEQLGRIPNVFPRK